MRSLMGISLNFRSASVCSASKQHEPGLSQPDPEEGGVPRFKLFMFLELQAATSNFNPDNRLGEGGFGQVYKGFLDDGSAVAIKKLKLGGRQGLKEWQTEIDFLGRLSHPNLVKLLGHCFEGSERLLVYEFMPQGSLENHLHGTADPLTWDLRIKIAVQVAQAFHFLHASDDRGVIFRDMKPANILLDDDYNVKISDFGLARLGPPSDESHVSTTVMGTHGYCAPEYQETGRLYIASDVYCFGVVLAEILTGLRAFDRRRPNGEQYLVRWIKPLLSSRRKLQNIMDERLQRNYPPKAALKTAKLALSCLAGEPKNRPTMREIVQALEQIQAIGEGEEEKRKKSTPTRRATLKHWLCSICSVPN